MSIARVKPIRCAAGALFAFVGSVAGGQGTSSNAARAAVIVGRVLDATERPLAGATVRLEDFEFETRSDADGTFAIDVDFIPDGVLTFRQIGFSQARILVHLTRGDTVRLTARLVRVETLDTVRTGGAAPNARLAGFHTRRARGRGVFVTQAEIDRRNPISAVDMLRATGAVRIVDSMGTLVPTSMRGGMWNARRTSFDPNCVMQIAIDGVLLPRGISLREMPSPREIAGIEIYKGAATLPAEFSRVHGDTSCGLIVVWTR